MIRLKKYCLAGAPNDLLRAALLSGGDAQAAWERWYAQVDFDKDTHEPLTYPLLAFAYQNLSKSGFPSPVMGKLKGIYRQAWLKNQLLGQNVIPVLRGLIDAGIPVLCLDDISAIQHLYPDGVVRGISQLDLMVQPGDVKRALVVLGEMGLYPKIHHPRHFLKVETPLVFWPVEKITVTLAWRPFLGVVDEAAALRYWERAQPTTWEGLSFHILDLGTTFLRACQRMVGSDPALALFALVDMSRMLSDHASAIHWEQVISEAQALGLVIPLRASLGVVVALLELPEAADLLARVSSPALSWRDRWEQGAVSSQSPQGQEWLLRWSFQYRRWSGDDRWWRLPRYLQYAWGVDGLSGVPRAVWDRVIRGSG
jgi:hypothetical protein